MSNALEAFLARAQRELDDAALKRFGEKVVSRWQTPLFMAAMPNPTCSATAADPKYGDTVTLFLKLDGQNIERATFLASGCGPTLVCGDAAAELAQGKTLAQARQLALADILNLLETLPRDKHRCAQLAIEALHTALDKC